MPRYIADSYLYRAIGADINGACGKCGQSRSSCMCHSISRMDICGIIEDAPTADVVERKVGKWIMDEHPHDGDCRCSCCWIAIDQMHERNHELLNALTGGRWWSFYKFCPQCGADMRGEEE